MTIRTANKSPTASAAIFALDSGSVGGSLSETKEWIDQKNTDLHTVFIMVISFVWWIHSFGETTKLAEGLEDWKRSTKLM